MVGGVERARGKVRRSWVRRMKDIFGWLNEFGLKWMFGWRVWSGRWVWLSEEEVCEMDLELNRGMQCCV